MDNRDPGVDRWFETYDNPQRELVEAVRRVILDADPRMTETIKWKAPTFMYKGNLASFFPSPPSTSPHLRAVKHLGLAELEHNPPGPALG